MCGIVGYVGDKNVIPVLIGGLQKLEYRGYDSAGIAYLDNGKMTIYKEKGKLAAYALGHTWGTQPGQCASSCKCGGGSCHRA